MTTFEAAADRSPAAGETTAAGWHDDPLERHRMRYHSGHEWTEHVTHYGPSPCSGCWTELPG